MGMNTTNPALDRIIRENKKPTPATNKHDTLHLMAELQYCWCMCAKCWVKYRTPGLGRCICPQCPCNTLF